VPVINNQKFSVFDERRRDNERGLLGWFKFNNLVSDISGNAGLASNAVGTAAPLVTYGDGVTGPSAIFTPVPAYVSLGNPSGWNLAFPGVTVCAWVKVPSTAGVQTIFGAWGGTTATDHLALWISAGQAYGAVGDGSTPESGFGAGSIATNQWTHIGFTWNASNRAYTIYINGAVVGTGTQTGNGIVTTSSANFLIGSQDTGGTRQLTGSVDDIRLYGVVLTTEEISAIYNKALAEQGAFQEGELPALRAAAVVPALSNARKGLVELGSWSISDDLPIIPRKRFISGKSFIPDNPPPSSNALEQQAAINSWATPDPLPTLASKVIQGVAAVSVPKTLQWLGVVLSAWLPLDASPVLARKLPPSLLAVRVDNPPTTTNALEQQAAINSWATPDPVPILASKFNPSLFAAALNPPNLRSWLSPVVASWQTTDPTPTLTLKLTPASVDAPPPLVRRDIPQVQPDALPTLSVKLVPQQVIVTSFPPFNLTWLPTVVSSWAAPDAQAPLAGKLNPAFESVPVNNPVFGKGYLSSQEQAIINWPPLPDPLPTLGAKIASLVPIVSSISANQTLDGLLQIATLVNYAPTYLPIGFGYVHTYTRKERKRIKKRFKELKNAQNVSPEEKAASLRALDSYLNIFSSPLSPAEEDAQAKGGLSLPAMQRALIPPDTSPVTSATVPLVPPSTTYANETDNASKDGFEWDDDGEEEELIQALLHIL